jgi:hypothetical protein
MRFEITDTGFTIEAVDLSLLLEVPPDDVRRMMRDGSITTRVERGEDEDQGRFRLSFFSPERQVRVVVNRTGEVLQRTRAPRFEASRRRGLRPESASR